MTATYTPPLPYPVTSPLTSGPYTQVVAPVASVTAVQVPTEPVLTPQAGIVQPGAAVQSVSQVQVPTEYLTTPQAGIVQPGAAVQSVQQGPAAPSFAHW